MPSPHQHHPHHHSVLPNMLSLPSKLLRLFEVAVFGPFLFPGHAKFHRPQQENTVSLQVALSCMPPPCDILGVAIGDYLHCSKFIGGK